MATERELELNTGAKIPIIGFGTWDLEGRAKEPVAWALEAGYRHIDTAKLYGTEADIGEAVRESGIPREELFITTKLWNSDQGYESALKAIDASLKRLGMEHVDLYLIHWPNGERKMREDTWRAMEEIQASGKAKAVGVSNYMRQHLEEMEEYAGMPPAVDQIEMHPFGVPDETVDYCHENGIVVTDYAPLARMRHFDHPRLFAIAKKHKCSVPRVMLRWGIQRGHVVIPKSHVKEHIEENINIFDFELDKNDMLTLDSLDRDESVT